MSPAAVRDFPNLDGSGMGRGDDRVVDNESVTTDDDVSINAVDDIGQVLVRRMTVKRFRQKLITHFDIAFQKREIQWPTRNRTIEHLI